MGQTMQVARRKYNFMVKGCFNIQKTIMELDQHFFLLFDQKWSKIVLIHRKCKFLFKKTRNMLQNTWVNYSEPSVRFMAKSGIG